MEWTLQQQGFDLCYDKRLYDRLVARGRRVGARPPAGRRRLPGAPAAVHREPRRAARGRDVRPAQARAAAVVMSTLPGRAALPRRPARGAPHAHPGLPRPRARRARRTRDLRAFYGRLLRAVAESGLRDGDWRLCDVRGLARQRLATAGSSPGAGERRRHGTSSSSTSPTRPAQARVRLPWSDLAGRSWTLADRLDGAAFERAGDELAARRACTSRSTPGRRTSSPLPKRRSRGAAASSPAAGSGRCSRSGSAAGSPGAPARPPRTGRRR